MDSANLQVFWRPPLTSSSQFILKDLHVPCGLLSSSDGQSPAIIQASGWIDGYLLEAAEDLPGHGLQCEDGGAEPKQGYECQVPSSASCPLVFHASPSHPSRWSGVLSLEPGSRLRLVGPSQFRLNYARARHVLPHAVLEETDAAPGTDLVSQWFEVYFNPRNRTGSKVPAEPSATIEVCGPKKGSTWQPVSRDRVSSPKNWPLVQAADGPWVTSQGSSCETPGSWRMAPKRIRQGPEPERPPALAVLVIMAAVPPEIGVGGMTPNWTLLAALDEALHRALGANYELHVVPIASEEQLSQLHPSRVAPLLSASRCGAVYFLSPQCVAGEFRTKNDMIHDVPLFGLMEALEAAGLPTIWPHPSYLYRILAGKEWPPQLCLSSQYHVPLTTRVSRQAVLTKGPRAAEEAWQSLCQLMESVGRPAPTSAVQVAVKVGCSWRSAGVQLCRSDLAELSEALSKAAAAGRHSSFMVQELVQGVLCEAMIYVIRGEVFAHPQYYRFPAHRAAPQYMPRKSAAQLLGGEEMLRQSEETMHGIVKHWMLWARSMSASPIPFLRIDFLLARSADGPVEVWTGEVSELGVAVELQGFNSHESRDLVMDAVVAAALKG